MADKAAKAAQEKEVIRNSFTSLSYLKSKIRESTLQEWKEKWEVCKSKGKHYSYIKSNASFSLKAPEEKTAKRTHSAYHQLELGKGFFKLFTSIIGETVDNKCFRECDTSQTLKHLILFYKRYEQEREILK